MWNNDAAAVLGIGTCKLNLRGGRTLYLYDVLYALEVQQNLVYVLVSINYDASIYVVQNSSTINDSNIITWHARLRHIGQD
jgi:hypothetical protein